MFVKDCLPHGAIAPGGLCAGLFFSHRTTKFQLHDKVAIHQVFAINCLEVYNVEPYILVWNSLCDMPAHLIMSVCVALRLCNLMGVGMDAPKVS